MNSVVVVESPAKAKTIENYLGDSYSVIASFGHIRDLEDKDGAVTPGSWSDIKWVLNKKGKKQVKEILSLLKKADQLIFKSKSKKNKPKVLKPSNTKKIKVI